MARKRASLKDKRKRVNVKLIKRLYGDNITEPYRILEQVIKNDRPDLKDVKFALAWHNGWRANADGLMTMGQCRKRSDLDKEIDEYDFIIMLNEKAWPGLSDINKERLIFHELCHAQVSIDTNGEPMLDDRGRIVCRVRRHDFEDFTEVIQKYGFKESMSQIAKEALKKVDQPLIYEIEQKQSDSHHEEHEDDTKDDGFESADDQQLTTNDSHGEEPQDIDLKLPKNWPVKCFIKIGKVDGCWRYGYYIKAGNLEDVREIDKCADFAKLKDCCDALLDNMNGFIDDQKNFKYSKSLKKKIESAVERYQLNNS